MGITLKAVNGNRKLFKACTQLEQYLSRYDSTTPQGTSPGNLYTARGSGRSVMTSLPVHAGRERVARLVRAVEGR